MGVSTDAILFWGFAYSEDDMLAADDDEYPFDEWETKYAALKGVKEPEEEFAHNPEVKALYDKYWDEKEEVVEAAGVKIDMHCCEQSPFPYIAIANSIITTPRGDISEVKSLDVDPSWEPKLRAFCETMSIPWRKPGWFQVSWWG